MNSIKIFFTALVVVACQGSQDEVGNKENAKHYSSNNSVNPFLFNENIGLVFTGYSFHIESYLNSSFLEANTISKIEVIQLSDEKAENFSSGTPFDTLNAIRFFRLSINKNGRVVQELDKGMGEYESTGDVSQLKYNEENQLQSVKTQTQYGSIQYQYLYNDEKKIESIQEYSNGNIDEDIHYIKDSTSKFTYRIKTPANASFSSLKIIKYDGVISESESLGVRKNLLEKVQAKQGVFANINDLNSSLDMVSYKNGLKMKEENWNLKKGTIQSYTDYMYSDSGALIETSGEHSIGGKLFGHSKEFLYNENGDLIHVLHTYQKPETLDHGTTNWSYEFVYDDKGFLLELIEKVQRGKFEGKTSKVLQFRCL